MNPRVSPADAAGGGSPWYGSTRLHTFISGLDWIGHFNYGIMVSLLFSQRTTWQTYLLTSRLLPLQLLFIRLTYLLTTTADGVCATFTRSLVILDVYSNCSASYRAAFSHGLVSQILLYHTCTNLAKKLLMIALIFDVLHTYFECA